MSCWSWPSWQCAAGGPWGRVGQACKLDAMLLLSSQGPFFTVQPQKQASYEPSQLPLSSAGPQISKKQEMEAKKMGEKEKNGRAVALWAVNHFTPFLLSLPTLIDTHQPHPSYTHMHCANPCPYSPPVPSSLLTPVLLCTSAICTTLRAASHPASH